MILLCVFVRSRDKLNTLYLVATHIFAVKFQVFPWFSGHDIFPGFSAETKTKIEASQQF